MLHLPERPVETFLTLYPAAQETGIFAFYAAAFASGQPERYQANYQHDGLDGFFYLVAQRSGERLVVSFTDTNDQPRSAVEEALRHSQARERAARAEAEAERQRLYNVLMQLPAQVAVYQGPNHLYQFVNPNYQRMFPHRSFVGRLFREGMPEAEGLGMVALFDQVYQTGQPYYGHEMEGWFDFGGTGEPEQFFFELSLHPLHNARGEVDGVLDFSYDVTEQVLARRQLQQLNQELESRVRQRTEELAATNEKLHKSNAHLTRTNSDLGTFVYTASHDLKAPITNIEGLVAALRDTLPAAVLQDEMVSRLLGLLDATTHRFVATINQLTDLSRLQRAYEEPAESLALAPVVAGVLADLAPALAEAHAAIQVQVPPQLCVSFASASLRSIVFNLLSNAIKYRAPQRPSQVWLRAEQQPQGVVVTVRDNGLGLTDAQQQRLFQAFQRLHTHAEGSGVGLYMIKRLIENAGATIAVTSTVDMGTTFTVVFPA